MSANGKRWTVSTEGDRLYDGDSVIRAEVYGPDELTADIAARLNGPSPAEVAALLRDIGHGYCGSCDRRVCLSCSADLDTVTSGRPNGGCFADCKLSAMIKQCEGA